ncbi:MAG: hypothetical protein ACTHLW_04845 [Verrucomicrobiota bacterium]
MKLIKLAIFAHAAQNKSAAMTVIHQINERRKPGPASILGSVLLEVMQLCKGG